jgi:hypothetical protein
MTLNFVYNPSAAQVFDEAFGIAFGPIEVVQVV